MINWIAQHNIEILGAVTGLIYLYLEIKEKVWLWPLGIITSAFYIYIFFVSKFYADMSLQVYYLVISIYGWWYWLRGGVKDDEEALPVTRTRKKTALLLVPITVALFALIAFVLVRFTDSPVPYGDAFTTALSITATWMLTRKMIEMWWLWMVINSVSLGLYIYKELYPTSVLFFFYFAMSIVGYVQWKKSMQREVLQEGV
ncbi:MAG TPA: nicotinamide riboside transporter PnuC [Tenuifilaceae bacterium]|nr:nicotinamide riboside transporter PnuC [Tenuifilaceae bacterium]